MMGKLDHEEIKKHIKSALGSVPFDAVLDAHPLMCPNDDFIKMASPPHSSSPPLFPWPLLCSFLPHPGLGKLQGNLSLVPDFNPPLPEDVIQRVRNRAHTKGVKKEEGKKEAEKARRKEE
jgi:hypothetical protein